MIFVFEDPRYRPAASRVLRRMPRLDGDAIRIQRVPGLRDRRGPVHAGAFLRERRVAFDCTRAEFPRMFAHEAAHFIWLRLANGVRRSWEEVVRRDLRARGELGWSAEWRKAALAPQDCIRRTRRWREYCSESFCDTAAWLWSDAGAHAEFTLPAKLRPARRRWFEANVSGRRLSI